MNHSQAVKKYNAKTYDSLTFRVKKSETALLKKAIKDTGVPINSFVLEAIRARIRMGEGEFAEIAYSYLTSNEIGTTEYDPHNCDL